MILKRHFYLSINKPFHLNKCTFVEIAFYQICKLSEDSFVEQFEQIILITYKSPHSV